jgi:glycosyltransferase involved in cell wall biosynthesis
VHDAMPPTLYSRVAYHHVKDATSRFVSVSHASANMLKAIGIPDSQVCVIYNGVDPAFQNGTPPPTPEISGPGPHIGVIALVEPIKGQDVALRAMVEVLECKPHAHLHIIGTIGHPDHEHYRSDLMRRAETGPLSGHVSFHGYQSNIPSWLAALDVVALPTIVPEALPTSIIEAMCLGRKVIGTDVGGTRELIQDKVTGRLVPPGDSHALASAICELADGTAQDPMGALAAEDARRRFSPQRFGDDLAALYVEMLRVRAS